jgi:hypothetical protein
MNNGSKTIQLICKRKRDELTKMVLPLIHKHLGADFDERFEG